MSSVQKYLAIFFVAIILLPCVAYSYSNRPQVEMENISITVRTGDTVWALAEQFKGKHEDTRAVVARIYDFNNLSGKVIKPGDSLIIPVTQKVRAEMLAKAGD